MATQPTTSSQQNPFLKKFKDIELKSQQKQEQIDQQKKQIDQQLATLKELEDQINTYSGSREAALNEELERLTKDREQQIEELERQLKETQEQLDKQDEKLGSLSSETKQLDDEIEEITKIVAERDAAITKIKESIARAEQQLKDNMAERARLLAEENEANEELATLSASMSEHTNSFSEEIVSLRRSVNALYEELSAQAKIAKQEISDARECSKMLKLICPTYLGDNNTNKLDLLNAFLITLPHINAADNEVKRKFVEALLPDEADNWKPPNPEEKSPVESVYDIYCDLYTQATKPIVLEDGQEYVHIHGEVNGLLDKYNKLLENSPDKSLLASIAQLYQNFPSENIQQLAQLYEQYQTYYPDENEYWKSVLSTNTCILLNCLLKIFALELLLKQYAQSLNSTIETYDALATELDIVLESFNIEPDVDPE
eukprot:UN01684